MPRCRGLRLREVVFMRELEVGEDLPGGLWSTEGEKGIDGVEGVRRRERSHENLGRTSAVQPWSLTA